LKIMAKTSCGWKEVVGHGCTTDDEKREYVMRFNTDAVPLRLADEEYSEDK
jgi:hypothetical protein